MEGEEKGIGWEEDIIKGGLGRGEKERDIKEKV